MPAILDLSQPEKKSWFQNNLQAPHSTEHSRVDGHALATKRAHTVRILLHTRARYIRVDIADRERIGHQLLHGRRRVNPRLEFVDCRSGSTNNKNGLTINVHGSNDSRQQESQKIRGGRMAVDNKKRAEKIRGEGRVRQTESRDFCS